MAQHKRKIINGKYTVDENFVTVFCNNVIYTMAKATREWASLSVGNRATSGHTLTQETYDKWESECDKTGSFVLRGNEWYYGR